MKIWKFLTLLAVSIPLAVSSLAAAAAEDKVIVIINGHEIKTSEVEIAAEESRCSSAICLRSSDIRS